MTISEMIIRINSLALKTLERSELKTGSMAKYGAKHLILQLLMHFSHQQRMYFGRFLSHPHRTVIAMQPLHML